MEDLSEEELEELASLRKNERMTELGRKGGLASGAKKENSGRFKKGDRRAVEMGKRGDEIRRGIR